MDLLRSGRGREAGHKLSVVVVTRGLRQEARAGAPIRHVEPNALKEITLHDFRGDARCRDSDAVRPFSMGK